jgi:phage-related minor tail protein
MPPNQPAPTTDKERLARIETEVAGVKDDIGELYQYLRNEFSKIISLQIEELRQRQEENKKAIEDTKAELTEKALVTDTIDLKNRTSAIEKWMWKIAGALVILAFLAPYILSQLGIILKQ